MRGYYAFTKKELVEQLRTYKTLVLLALFFFFGITSPLTAKFLPEILSGMKVQGMVITIPEPTILDSYSQFFKNLTQLGMIAVLLVFGGVVSNELAKGTLINILAKGLPRYTVLLSKYTATVILWTMGYVVAGVTTFGYTVYLFGNVPVENLIFSMFCLWLFGCFVLALIFLSSTVAPGNFGGLILTAAVLLIMITINVLPWIAKYNPVTLASKNMALLSGAQDVSGLIITVLITCILTVLCMALSIFLFAKKRL